jgi:geranylgeranylglycerol-phosphate geranylgeranyltransferase
MQIGKKIRAMIQIIRPELPLTAGLCVVIGQAVALGALPPVGRMLLGFLLGLVLSSSAMIFNDYFDLEVDRVNSPDRPLPAGLLTPREVIIFGLVTGAVAWIIAAVLHPLALVLSVVLWILGFLYNWKLKAAGLWGNLIVSSNVAMTFIIGGISVGQAANPMLWTFGFIAFFFDLAEEIAGDAMDMEGDQKRGSKSLAILYGRQTALLISTALFGVVIALTLVPILWNETSLAYWLPILIIDAWILFFTRRLLFSVTPTEGRQAMRSLYLGVSLGLLVFLVSRFLG